MGLWHTQLCSIMFPVTPSKRCPFTVMLRTAFKLQLLLLRTASKLFWNIQVLTLTLT